MGGGDCSWRAWRVGGRGIASSRASEVQARGFPPRLAANRGRARRAVATAGRVSRRIDGELTRRRPIHTLLRIVAVIALLGLVACETASEEEEDAGAGSGDAGAQEETDADGEDAAEEDREESEPDEPEEPEEEPPPHGGAYGVSAGHPDAVEAGLAVLEEGGTAMDAAIAASFAVSVVEPFASGMGGGGSAVVHEPEQDPVAYDYRDPVPQSGEVPSGGTGIPGFVAGMEELHANHGSGSFDRLVEPAIRLAADGAEVSASLDYWLRSGGIPVGQLPHLYPDGTALSEGDELVQEELAETLERVAEGGAEAFYRGDLGEELADSVAAIDTESLAAYEVQRFEPAAGEFAGHQVLSSAPALAGPVVIQFLQVAEALGIEDYEHGSADYIHAMNLAWRVAEANLNSQIADTNFVDVPVDEITDAERNAALAEQLDMGSVPSFSSGQRDAGLDEPNGNTTHITVVDAEGAMVSMTNTLSNFWGSGDYALGFFINDQLRNFDIRPGSPNPPPEPGKRIVGSSAPTIVLDDEGRPVLGLGSPGGLRIPSILSNVLVLWGLQGQDLADAVEAPRQHGEGGTITFEELPSQGVRDELSGRGHSAFESPSFPYYFGSVQALEIDYDAQEVRGAEDPRRDGEWSAGEGSEGGR